MRQVSLTVYSLNELPAKQRQRAHDDHIANAHEYIGFEDDLSSLEAFANCFNKTINDYSIGPYQQSYIDLDDDDFRGCKPSLVPKIESDSDYLTGYYLDEILQNTFWKEVQLKGDVRHAALAALDEALKAIIEEMEHQLSYEYFEDLCEANEYEFLTNGWQWNWKNVELNS